MIDRLNPVGPDGRRIDPFDRSLSASRRAGAATSALTWPAIVACVYVAVGRLGLLASGHHGLTSVWPAAGVAMAAVLLGGRRMLAAVAIGAFSTALSAGESAPGALLTTGASTLEPLIAYELLRRIPFSLDLKKMGDVIAYTIVAALLSTAAGAVLGALALLAAGRVGGGLLPVAWRDWWVADTSGVLLVGSAILVLARSRVGVLRSRVGLGLALATAAEGIAALLLLRGHASLPYLVLPPLIVLAVVYGRRGAAAGGLVVSAVGVVLTARGHGPFSAGQLDTALIRAEAFGCVSGVTALLVAAAQSERRLAQTVAGRLAVSEGALAEAQHLAHIGSFEHDLETGRTTWSRELWRILGCEPDEVEPSWRAWRRYIHEDDRPRLDDAARRARLECAPATLLHRIVRPDGQVRTVEARFRFECDPDGRPVRVVGACQDVTARKLAEERFRSLFEDAPYPILVFDGCGKIVLSNFRSQALFGLSETELAGRQVEDLVLRPDGAERPWYEIGAEAEPDSERDGEGELELRARRSNGTELSVEVSLTPLVAEDGVLVSAALRDVTEMRAAAESLSFQARHDSLTGLPNRLLFLERLDLAITRARHTQRPLAVVFLDLDDFKLVNDMHGHDVGDALLAALTPRLGAAVRGGDTIARLGGDEFVALCEDLSDEDQALYIAERITEVSRRTIAVGGRDHTVSISAGVVVIRNPDVVSAQGVLRDADAAMYAAKAGGKGRVAVFDESMRERRLERVAVEASLRGARQRGELALVYQPVVALEDKRVVAIEALLRWRHPIRGELPPSEFMQVAETTGLIADMGEWVIEEACRQAALWRDIAGLDRAVPVSVNISAYQLTRADLAGAVQRSLRRTGLEPHLLMLEVTEGALLEDISAARRELSRLKELGVQLVVDDFGTGFSSLSALRDLMIDGLKLDRSFVARLVGEAGGGEDDGAQDDGGAMVGAVLSLATALDAEVTAEGVETWSQVSRLRRQGCDFAQGFLFARPGPASALTPMLVPAEIEEECGLDASVARR